MPLCYTFYRMHLTEQWVSINKKKNTNLTCKVDLLQRRLPRQDREEPPWLWELCWLLRELDPSPPPAPGAISPAAPALLLRLLALLGG